MLSALLLAAAVSAAADPPSELARLQERVSVSAEARRLLAAVGPFRRVEVGDSDLPLAVDLRPGPKPELVADLTRMERLSPGEAEAEFALALARAALAAPLTLVEVEQARLQRTAQVLVEAAAVDAELSKALRAAERGPSPNAPELDRAARFLALFEKDPAAAWAWAESEPPVSGAPRLTELEDLLSLYPGEIRAFAEPPEGRYTLLGRRRYPARLVRDAWRVRKPGALHAVREALGVYDTVGIEPLRAAIARWRRAAPGRP